MATLTVSHHLYLTKEQRYELNQGKEIKTVGVCVPVWFQKGNTSEPAQEIFCKYKIYNPKNGANIKQDDEGFEIWMPSINKDEEYIEEEGKIAIQKKIGTSENLLDYKDGGTSKCDFKLYQKLLINDDLHHLVHFIEIKPIEILFDTMG
jgi:hypothetical protein